MTNNNNTPALIQKDITDSVSGKLVELKEEGLVLPKNYNANNALKSAFFALQNVQDRQKRPALQVCTQSSIANTLLDMVTQGLSPAKTQCYFVVYGDQLQLNRSYFGTQAVVKRLNNVNDIWANVIYEDDIFDYEVYKGRERLVKHETNFLNRDKPIVGAYAIVSRYNESIDDIEEILTVMTMKEIETSWGQSKTNQSVHKKFPQEMAKRTVINRAAKAFINTSDDSDLLVQAINNTTESEYDNERKDITPEENQEFIDQNANREFIDINTVDDKEVDQETGEIKKDLVDSDNKIDKKQDVINGNREIEF